MTNENMIKQLKRLIPSLQYADDVNAVKGAIKALSQEPTDENLHREREQAYMQGYEDASKKYRQEPCTDAVSRGVFEQVMWERDVAIDQLHELGYELGQKIEPCDDVISRQAVLDVIKSLSNANPSYWIKCDVVDREDLIDEISELPSVTQKSGKWRYVAEDKYSCSKCGTTTRVDESGIDEKPMYKFCPYCGAKMVKPQESEE